MDLEPTAADESEILATAIRAYLAQTRFAFTGLTGKKATLRITRVVAEWARASGWREADGRRRCAISTRHASRPRAA